MSVSVPARKLVNQCLDRVSALFAFQLMQDESMVYRQTLLLKGNALDLAVYDRRCSFAVSVDNIHKCCSTKLSRDNPAGEAVLLQIFILSTNAEFLWVEDEVQLGNIQSLLNHAELQKAELDTSRISSLLYNVESLRKTEYDN